MKKLSPDEIKQLFDDMGMAIMDVADNASVEPGGDKAVFGSTNDLDTLRDLRQRFFEHRFLEHGL